MPNRGKVTETLERRETDSDGLLDVTGVFAFFHEHRTKKKGRGSWNTGPISPILIICWHVPRILQVSDVKYPLGL